MLFRNLVPRVFHLPPHAQAVKPHAEGGKMKDPGDEVGSLLYRKEEHSFIPEGRTFLGFQYLLFTDC